MCVVVSPIVAHKGGSSRASRFDLDINGTLIQYNVVIKSDGTIAIGDYYP